MQIRSVGIDLGKTTFHLVALGDNGKVLLKKKASIPIKQVCMFAVKAINCFWVNACPASSGAVRTQNAKLPITPAGSTGRCNTGLQFTRRRFKAQSLSRALIEAQSYLVEIGLSVTGQVGFLREVLS